MTIRELKAAIDTYASNGSDKPALVGILKAMAEHIEELEKRIGDGPGPRNRK
jgi:hypothetical protein